jgi:hypothetical protein
VWDDLLLDVGVKNLGFRVLGFRVWDDLLLDVGLKLLFSEARPRDH